MKLFSFIFFSILIPSLIQKYYSILGVSPQASAAEIKRAYRSRAKLMHPDVSKSADAHEQFVLLNEAYEYLINVGTEGQNSTTNSSESYQRTQEDWQQQQRENAKERAREYARMRYAEFIKSDLYKEQKVYDTITAHLGVLVSLLLFTAFPILMVNLKGIEALFGVLIINVILSGLHIKSYQNLKKLSFQEFLNSIRKMIFIPSFQAFVLIAINIPIVINVVVNTLVSISFVLSAYALSILLFLVISRRAKIRNMLSFGVAPTLVSLLFLVNYVFASFPTQEKFTLISDGYQENSMITLEGNQFDEYPGIRIFFDFDEMRFADEVLYTFEYGLLGFIVMTDYEFRNN